MGTKVIGPIVKSTDANNCPTGWCDSSMPAPKNWGSPEEQKSFAPKNPPHDSK